MAKRKTYYVVVGNSLDWEEQNRWLWGASEDRKKAEVRVGILNGAVDHLRTNPCQATIDRLVELDSQSKGQPNMAYIRYEVLEVLEVLEIQ